ncbi:YraN family protein [Methylobacterium sp. SyP6R]|uniref:YraN family protein n=1 Tax=Methylobacterium sp. SyP6R TaxID=2718876 RepID=UPI001F26C2B0|nr:YraN family protein [Methylobacterium sp. SyP6R]MCF4125745.1 YraN family protein [Methylobacterium sp. SyP6R]
MPAKPDAARRRLHLARGRRAEWLAASALLLKGYRPLAWRVSIGGGEIDLIVRRGGVVAFVEVKARPTLADASIAIDARKRRLFSRAVRAWIARAPWSAALTLRADAVFVAPGRWPRHVVSAFELEMDP